MRINKLLPHLWIILPLAIFLAIKLSGLSIRLSDTNVYFYTSYSLLKGKLLYKDIFFTDLPLFPYLSSLYLFISHNNPYFYYFTAALEASATAVLIYWTVIKESKRRIIALTTVTIYLFSFMLLSTSDHQTGVFAASLLMVGSYLAYSYKKYVLVGMLAALAVLCKAYFAPFLISIFIFHLVWKNKRESVIIFISSIITGLIVLLPIFIFSGEQFINDVFLFSLTRSAGADKVQLFQFFVFRDSLIAILLIANLLLFRKKPFFALFSVFSILFLVFYQHIFYLYLNFMLPILCISLSFWYQSLEQRFTTQKMVLPTIAVILVLLNLTMYFSGFQQLQKVSNINAITDAIKQSNPNYIYGSDDIAPIAAYLSNVPLLNNIIDTNPSIYRKQLLNAHTLSEQATSHRTVIISHGAFYPQFGVNQPLFDEIFDQKLIEKKCKEFASSPVQAEGSVNQINLFKCYK